MAGLRSIKGMCPNKRPKCGTLKSKEDRKNIQEHRHLRVFRNYKDVHNQNSAWRESRAYRQPRQDADKRMHRPSRPGEHLKSSHCILSPAIHTVWIAFSLTQVWAEYRIWTSPITWQVKLYYGSPDKMHDGDSLKRKHALICICTQECED